VTGVNLACSACVPTGLYILLVLISFLMIAQRPSQDPLDRFLRFFSSPNDRYLFIDDRLGPLFPIPQGMLPWQPILGKIYKMTIRQAGVPKLIGIWQFRIKNS